MSEFMSGSGQFDKPSLGSRPELDPAPRQEPPTRQELERKVFNQQNQLRKLNSIVDELEEANGQLVAELVVLRKEQHATN